MDDGGVRCGDVDGAPLSGMVKQALRYIRVTGARVKSPPRISVMYLGGSRLRLADDVEAFAALEAARVGDRAEVAAAVVVTRTERPAVPSNRLRPSRWWWWWKVVCGMGGLSGVGAGSLAPSERRVREELVEVRRVVGGCTPAVDLGERLDDRDDRAEVGEEDHVARRVVFDLIRRRGV